MAESSARSGVDGSIASKPATRITAAVLGNALEFYDFTVYAAFAVFIGRAFFPTHNPYASVMLSVATFGVGFVTRPLGRNDTMLATAAALTFVAALIAAIATLYATVLPALPKIRAALAGTGATPVLPPLPARRASVMRVTARPAAGQAVRWRAAA